MRYGLMSNFRRSWSEVGKRAVLDQKQGYSNSYLYTAINPVTGNIFNLLGFPDMDTETELVFLQELKKQHPDQNVAIVIDNAPCHRPKVLQKIPGLYLIFLPSYSPELNPVERFFEEVRRTTCNKIFTTLTDVEETITQTIKSFTTEKLKQLCGYSWILKQYGEVN